jgi:hypothetical protein
MIAVIFMTTVFLRHLSLAAESLLEKENIIIACFISPALTHIILFSRQ